MLRLFYNAKSVIVLSLFILYTKTVIANELIIE